MGAGIVDIALAIAGDLGALLEKTLHTKAINRQNPIFSSLHIPPMDHGAQTLLLAGSEILGFGIILRHMIELPGRRIELG